MCGLYGWVAGEKAKPQHLAQLRSMLLPAAERRGTDSHGVVCVWSPDLVTVNKGLGRVTAAVSSVELAPIVMGHTRAATLGDVNLRNAHPFSIDGIIAAHNGVVTNFEELFAEDERPWQVDSEALIYRISMGADCSDVEAWGAVTWVKEAEPRGIYLVKMPGGTLEVVEATLPNGVPIVVYASVLPKGLGTVLKSRKRFRLEENVVYYLHAAATVETPYKLAVKEAYSSFTSYWGWSGERNSDYQENVDDIWERYQARKMARERALEESGISTKPKADGRFSWRELDENRAKYGPRNYVKNHTTGFWEFSHLDGEEPTKSVTTISPVENISHTLCTKHGAWYQQGEACLGCKYSIDKMEPRTEPEPQDGVLAGVTPPGHDGPSLPDGCDCKYCEEERLA